jgi:hypothetical protein
MGIVIRHYVWNRDAGSTEGLLMGWKTPKFEYVNGYKIVEREGPTFKVFDGDQQLGDDFPYSGEAAAYARSLPQRDLQQRSNSPSYLPEVAQPTYPMRDKT